MSARPSRTRVALAGLALVALALGWGSVASSIAQEKKEPTPSAKALVAVCMKGLQQAEEMRKALGADKGPEDIARWSLRLVAATRELGDAERTREALKDHLGRTLKFEEWTKAQRKAGTASELDVLESEFRRAEAEMWVEQAPK